MMKATKTTIGIISATAVALGGLGVYLLRSNKKARTQGYGNRARKDKPAGSPGGGVPTSRDTLGGAITEPDWNNPFDMHYEEEVKQWVSPKGIVVLNQEEARAMAKALYEARGAWWQDDDEATVNAIFGKRLRDKVQVANLSRAFWQQYKTDLWEYLHGFLSDGELERYVQGPVRNLPDYQLA